MSNNLSQAEIGKRIMQLRKAKGLSQEELAKDVKISRSSLVQIEQGNRYLDVMELQRLSHLLEFSLDDFLSKNFTVAKETLEEEKPQKQKSEMRIAVPTMNIAKFKNVLLYILERCAGKPNVGETVLYKLLYFADFNYYELYEEHLSGAKYRKLPFGPVPKRFETIVNSMVEKGEVEKIKTEYFGKTQTRYIPLQKADITKLNGGEIDVLNKVIAQMSDWSASAISNYSHNDMPWKASADGEEISYELAFYRRQPYSVRTYTDDNE